MESSVEAILASAAKGEREGLQVAMPMVYERARRLADGLLVGDRAQRWVGSESLVHMAVLRLLQSGTCLEGKDQHAVLMVLAKVMRHVVVDVARRERAIKRGGGRVRLAVSPDELECRGRTLDVVELDDAIEVLALVDAEAAGVVESRLWGGMTLEQVALAMGVTEGRARTLWNRGKAFLAADLASGDWP